MPPMPPQEGDAVNGNGAAAVGSLTRDPPDIESLLALNPKIKPYANAVPSVVTKKVKKHWKRNADKADSINSCGYALQKYLFAVPVLSQ